MSENSRILVVDDDCTLLDMAEEAIGDCYDVILADSGKRALQILEGGEVPGLILLDVDMPGMDGFETLHRIRGLKPCAAVPVIFLTGISNSQTELAGLSLGAQDYITKPFVRENLLTRIRLRLESAMQARQLEEMRGRLHEEASEEARFHAFARELTPAEREVTRLIIQGLGNQEIAWQLGYSAGYVKNLATGVYGKLGIRGRPELRKLFRK